VLCTCMAVNEVVRQEKKRRTHDISRPSCRAKRCWLYRYAKRKNMRVLQAQACASRTLHMHMARTCLPAGCCLFPLIRVTSNNISCACPNHYGDSDREGLRERERRSWYVLQCATQDIRSRSRIERRPYDAPGRRCQRITALADGPQGC
jgi:hypothetical protein